MSYFSKACLEREELLRQRRYLHQNAETGLHLPKTKSFIKDTLHRFNIECSNCGHGLSALIGSGCVVGNSTELKNVILFDNVQVPHYNYVGDSILGYKAHMGAGSITSNVKSDKTLVVIHGETKMETGQKKVGALLGDFVEIGCNSVLNPGTVVGRNSNIYPLSCVRGTVPADSIYKTGGIIVKKV